MSDGTITVGMLRKGETRRFLNLLKWEGEIADWYEDKYVFESVFYLKGLGPKAPALIRRFEQHINQTA